MYDVWEWNMKNLLAFPRGTTTTTTKRIESKEKIQ